MSKKPKNQIGFYNDEMKLVILEESGPKPGWYWKDCSFRHNPNTVQEMIDGIEKILIHFKNRVWEKSINAILYDTRPFKIPSNLRLRFRQMVESKNVHFGNIDNSVERREIVKDLTPTEKKVKAFEDYEKRLEDRVERTKNSEDGPSEKLLDRLNEVKSLRSVMVKQDYKKLKLKRIQKSSFGHELNRKLGKLTKAIDRRLNEEK